MSTALKTSEAMFQEREYVFEESGDLCFAPVAPRLIAFGVSRHGEPFKVTVANSVKPVFDTGKSGKGSYSMVADQSEERRQIIVDQVRFAANLPQLETALEAAYWYDPSVYQSLSRQYGDRFEVVCSGTKATTESLELANAVGLAWLG